MENDKALNVIQFRINQIVQALKVRDSLPDRIVDDYESRLEELELLMHYLKTA